MSEELSLNQIKLFALGGVFPDTIELAWGRCIIDMV